MNIKKNPAYPFAEEHESFRKELSRWLAQHVTPHVDDWEENAWFPDDVFRQMGQAGWLGVMASEAMGGSGGDCLHGAVLVEEMSRCGSTGLMAGIGMHTLIITPGLERLANDEQKERFLKPMVQGQKIAALGLTEPVAGSDLAGIRSKAVRDGDHYILNGAKTFITNGKRADLVLVLCKTDESKGHAGFSTLIVEKDMPGFSVSKDLKKLGWWASDTAELAFEDVRVPVANRLGEEGQGFINAMINLEWERLIMCLGSVTGSDMALELTEKYVREREAFGRPIGKFQVIKHKLVDMATEIEMVKTFVYNVLKMHHAKTPCLKEVSMAKIKAMDLGVDIASEAIQIHGGYGYMREYRLERMWRDARLGPIGGGTTEIMKEIVAKMMGL